jgi:hypothetical protein
VIKHGGFITPHERSFGSLLVVLLALLVLATLLLLFGGRRIIGAGIRGRGLIRGFGRRRIIVTTTVTLAASLPLLTLFLLVLFDLWA